ncbi:MAG: UDP-glucose 4-epimerase GalE [Deferribacteraceae bacterium]|jgi:UDP-glucose 4-epimerase|nr:UDP-glucose 4-epimerase GalE [Deferribacteraceae bacterium]
MNTILVVGAAGYIGSHTLRDLKERKYNTVALDNLSEGHLEALCGGVLENIDLADTEGLNNIFKKYNIDAVMHFAAYAYVGESVINPRKYYQNNVLCTFNLLNAMLENNVHNIVFSSTCAIYGNPVYTPIDEKHPQSPVNPYGNTKYIIEKMLADYKKAYGLKYIALRYFNAAGARESAEIGESHNTETHLIPLVLQTLTGKKQCIDIFGDDYDTPDGTCIRDYIHVNDLADAHRLAVEHLMNNKGSEVINLGTGKGHSVKEIISVCESVAGKRAPYKVTARREGDPASLVASNCVARDLLGWEPKYTDIKDIIRTAWNWERNRKY